MKKANQVPKIRIFYILKTTSGQSSSKIVVIPTPYKKFQTVSFVNGMTVTSGVHIDKWTEALFRPLQKKLCSKDMKITIADVKNQFMLFILCVVDKPEFDSQTKEKLKNPTPPVEVSDNDIKTLMKWKAIAKIEERFNEKIKKSLSKKRRRLPVIRELEDAIQASNKKSLCTLIFCEGLSAKNFVS